MKQLNNLISKLLLMLFLCSAPYILSAQNATISGTIDDAGDPLYGATVVVAGTTNGTTTDFDGNYTISVEPGTHTLIVSYIGYADSQQSFTVGAGENYTMNMSMAEGIAIDEVVVIGSRSAGRTNVRNAVPVDIIDVSKLSSAAPQTSVNELLTYSVPSFSSNTQTISDGTDHIDPASLRGLGPDQVLVLLNQKRRHNTSLVNVNGTFGRGNVGTDMNAIPASAIGNIQVLRDGAAAQYGSDAIAGVINVQLKKNVNELAFNVTTGANLTSSDKIGAFGGEKKSIDGEKTVIGVNYGLPLGSNGGFINMTGEFDYRGSTNRMLEFQGSIFNAQNSIDRVALANGASIASLTNDQVRQYAGSVTGYSGELFTQIAGASDEDLPGLLGTNVTEYELAQRGQERSLYNMRVGQSEGRGGKFFANMEIPLSENMKVYSFGGTSYRNGISGCFFRTPNRQDRVNPAIYFNGTVPLINSHITDNSATVGIKGDLKGWSTDLSTTYGNNSFNYEISNSQNATLNGSSPTTFNAGGHTFNQSTSNFDIAQYFDELGSLAGLNVAFGAEYRFENYVLNPGEPVSYLGYDITGDPVSNATPSELLAVDPTGRNQSSGAQCFSGFLPSNFTDARRSSVAGYTDVELDVSESFLVGAAVRFENYSDFGSTFNWKLSSRYSITDNINIRAAAATGFRAPSLHQKHFSRTSTIFVDGIAEEVGTFGNESLIAGILGIPSLKEETSTSFSAGITARPVSNLSITIDGYRVKIDDRIVLTGNFEAGNSQDPQLAAEMEAAGATRANFFTNAINSTSTGIDVVVSHKLNLGDDYSSSLTNDFAATFSKTEAERDGDGAIIVNATEEIRNAGLAGNYFDEASRIYLEEAVPRVKLTLSNTYQTGALSIYLRNTYFGSTTEATNTVENQTVYDPKIVTDLSVGYKVTDNLQITVGSNNILDTYPQETIEANNSSGRFLYSRRAPQFGTNGRYVFGRISFTIK